jgi:hypothetical protein
LSHRNPKRLGNLSLQPAVLHNHHLIPFLGSLEAGLGTKGRKYQHSWLQLPHTRVGVEVIQDAKGPSEIIQLFLISRKVKFRAKTILIQNT